MGGLLWLTSFQLPASSSTYFAAYDGNGNVAALLHAPSSMPHARYEYGPFGAPIRATGPAAALNPFRFSTKRTDNTTDLVVYEYRAYSPALGRWLSRDPIGDEGGEPNLYGFVVNNSPSYIDTDGRAIYRAYCPRCLAPILPFDPKPHICRPKPVPPNDPDDWYDPLQAVACFCKSYWDMRRANTIGADKYFHCLAHCCAAKKGARQTAVIIGLARELCDICRKRDRLLEEFLDSMSDMEANQHGLNCPKDKSCKGWCSKYRPKTLDPKY